VTVVDADDDTDALGVEVDAVTLADGSAVTLVVVIDCGPEDMVADAGVMPDGAAESDDVPFSIGVGAGPAVGGLDWTMLPEFSGTAGGALVGFSGLAGSITDGLEARPTPTSALASSGSMGAPCSTSI